LCPQSWQTVSKTTFFYKAKAPKETSQLPTLSQLPVGELPNISLPLLLPMREKEWEKGS